MAYPAITNSFTSGRTAIHSQWNTNFADLVNGLSDGTKDSKINNLTAASSLAVTGDLHTVDLTDYSASSTINGWASYTAKSIYYRKIGKTIYVFYQLAGTASASISIASFTLPYKAAYTNNFYKNLVWNLSNTTYSIGFIRLYAPSTSTSVLIYKDLWDDTWTLSTPKSSCGSFSFEVTT